MERGEALFQAKQLCIYILYLHVKAVLQDSIIFRLIHLTHNLFGDNKTRTEFCKSGSLRQKIEGGTNRILNY